MASFFYYLAGLGTVLAVSLIFPVLVGFSFGETEAAQRLLIYALLGGFISACALMGTSGRAGALGRMQGIKLVVLSWLFFPLVMTFPIADILSIPYGHALFEAVSGFTTTGATGLVTLETVPKTIVVLRAQLQWLGALATIITFTLVLAPNGIGGLPQGNIYQVAVTVLSKPSSLMRYCLKVSQAFVAISLVCFACLMLAGTAPFDALVLTMTTVSTGGFMPSDRALDETVSGSGLMVMTVFLLVAATSVFWHRMLVNRRSDELKRHRESYFVIAAWLVLGFYIAISLISASGLGGAERLYALVEGMFNAASLVSTSGVETRPGLFSILSPLLVLSILIIGGGCFSTSGGTKFFRIGGMSVVAYHEINRLIYPRSIRPGTFGSVRFDMQIMKSVWSFFIFTVIVLLGGGMLLAISGMNFQAAFTASVAAFSNAGPAYGPQWGVSGANGWPEFFEMDLYQKMVLSLLMILGRLEIVVVFGALNLFYWVER